MWCLFCYSFLFVCFVRGRPSFVYTHESAGASSQECGVSGCGVSKYCSKPHHPYQISGVRSPRLQFLSVNKLLLSNPTSSNTTSLNSRSARLIRARESDRQGNTVYTRVWDLPCWLRLGRLNQVYAFWRPSLPILAWKCLKYT